MNIAKPWRQIRRSASISVLFLICLGLLPPMASADSPSPVKDSAEAWSLAQAVALSTLDAGTTGIYARPLGREELSRQHGKNAVPPSASSTRGVAVILWDERGSPGGQSTRVSMTGTGNVQSSSLTLSAK